MPFHAGLVSYKGKGILLAAQGGGGKSTACRLLPSKWNVLCDDEAMIVKNNGSGYNVHPMPTWSELFVKGNIRRYDFNKKVKLCAIFFLEQSLDNVVNILPFRDSILPISHYAAQIIIKYRGHWPYKELYEIRKNIFLNASDIAKNVPAFKLKFNINKRFWEKIEQVI